MRGTIKCAVVCAWCNKEMGSKDMLPNGCSERIMAAGKRVVSHGICEDCKEKLLFGIRTSHKLTKEAAVCSTQAQVLEQPQCISAR